MSKLIHVLHDEGVGNDLAQYVNNLISVESMYACVVESIGEKNIYKTIASFEDAGIVSAAEIPAGKPEDKINYILTRAIEEITPCIHANMQLAANAAKQWSQHVVIESQQEKLNAAIAKLTAPVKNEGIPAYSELNDGQRARIQKVFQSTLKQDEPVEINLITEAIDRYNAGANLGVMFKALNLKLDYSNGIALYEQDAYETLMSDEMFAYLFERWEAYQRMIIAIGQHKYLTPKTLGDILDAARAGKRISKSYDISAALSLVGFDKALSEYNANTKSTTEYSDVKPYITGDNVVRPASKNNLNRLAGLSKMISELQTVPMYRVDESQTDMDSEAIRECLAVYHEVMDEVTNNLMAFIFLTQTTIRNSTVINDVITSIDMVDGVVSDLFENVKNSVVEDGVVSQEGFKELITKVKNLLVKKDEIKQLSVLSDKKSGIVAIDNTVREYNELSDALFKLKLRDNHSLDESRISAFKKKHGATIARLFGTTISRMDIESLFSFMSNGIFTSPIKPEHVSSMGAAIFDNRDSAAQIVYKFVTDDKLLNMYLEKPYSGERHGFYDCFESAYTQYEKLLNLSIRRPSAAVVKQTLDDVMEYFTVDAGGTYFSTTGQLNAALPGYNIDVITPKIYISPLTGKRMPMGYRNPTNSTFDTIFSKFEPNPKTVITLNTIKNKREIVEFSKRQFDYNHYRDGVLIPFINNDESGYTKMIELHNWITSTAPKVADVIAECPDLSKNDVTHYIDGLVGIISDTTASLNDINNRAGVSLTIARSAGEVSNQLRALYRDFNEMAEDFISIAK